MPETLGFFDEKKTRSEVKSLIVANYFDAWAKIMLPSVKRRCGHLGYIDLYSGPGRYKDGRASTPIMVLEKAINNPALHDCLKSYFNDYDQQNIDTLRGEISRLPGIEKLAHQPKLSCEKVADDSSLFLDEIENIPSFAFIDPFGYKGVTRKIISGVSKSWGSDCVFFFNYTRVNAAITNEIFSGHIENLFGREEADALRKSVDGASPNERERIVLKGLANTIRKMGVKYVLPFLFEGGRRQHIIFISKDFTGYDLMKTIMAGKSSTEDQGVPSFSYSPEMEAAPLLFSLDKPLDKLYSDLRQVFSGKTLTTWDIYKEHSFDKPFILKNYQDVLKKMHGKGDIQVKRPSGKPRRAGTFPKDLMVTFSRKGAE